MKRIIQLELTVRLYQDKLLDSKLADAFDAIRRLARKHQRLAEMSCNGVGYVKGQMYYNGRIDDYAKRQYGPNVKSAYLDKDCEETIFDNESDKVQDKINALAKPVGLTVEYQGDPRGATVKVKYQDINLTDILWL